MKYNYYRKNIENRVQTDGVVGSMAWCSTTSSTSTGSSTTTTSTTSTSTSTTSTVAICHGGELYNFELPLASRSHIINQNGATSRFEMCFWGQMFQQKHVSNPNSVIKKFKPHLIHVAFSRATRAGVASSSSSTSASMTSPARQHG